MKTIIASVCASLCLALPAMADQSQPQQPAKEMQIGVNSVYVPGGFDSNSDAYVVVNGIFPSGCYKWDRAEVSHIDAFKHEVKSIAKVGQGMCIMVLVPFQSEVRLGKFAAGEHTLRFLNGDGSYIEKTMKIE